jgi:protocatechuate 3,4-dioxygenase beta subunit
VGIVGSTVGRGSVVTGSPAISVEEMEGRRPMSDQLTTSGPRLEPDGSAGGALPSRRTLLKAGAALGLGAVGLGAAAAAAQDATPGSTTAEGSPVTCVLTSEVTEGPYYVADELIRKDITEGKPGVPLQLQIAVMDTNACAPLANAAVDVWHCDARGYYSGISGENPGDGSPTTDENLTTTFLRGIQLTDADGAAEFATIYPGWYLGRTIHIHMKVHVDGTAGKTYEDGHVSHTGQLFFDDAITDQVLQTESYAGRSDERRTLNDADNVLDGHADEPGFFLTLTPLVEGSFADGFRGTITIGVDPNATPAATGGGGPGGPPSGGPGGTPPPNGGG